MDLLCLGIMAALFALSFGLIAVCDRLAGG
jgi:hypothetical protein